MCRRSDHRIETGPTQDNSPFPPRTPEGCQNLLQDLITTGELTTRHYLPCSRGDTDRIVSENVRGTMPTISVFYGIVIQMYWQDHPPPHFHALYAEHEVLIDFRNLSVLRGSLPRRAMGLVLEWAAEHRDELTEDWISCSNLQTPKPIAPLK